jgi:thiamine biosynthesis lipoprotein
LNLDLTKIRKTILLYFVGVSSCFSQEILQGFAQGTSYRILYYAQDKTVQKHQIDSVLNQLDSSLSIYKPYSLISRFNSPRTKEIVLDKHLKNVIKASFKHWKLSNGKFDITIAPLSELYGFGNKKVTSPPTASQIKDALQWVGMKKLKLDGDKLFKLKSQLKIDVNGIAQGYSVDVLADFLELNSIQNYLVELGGEIRTSGTHPDGRRFKIALEIPNSKNDSVAYKTIEIYNTAVTTSGTSKKHHINPKNGRVFSSPILSATVITVSAMDADAIDNYIIAFTRKKALKWAKKNNIQVILSKE